MNLPGLTVSILLLSLGAPFWYSVLNRLLQVQSVLAQKDDMQRVIRYTTQPSEDASDRGIGTAGDSHPNGP